jgi:hypothetical protein
VCIELLCSVLRVAESHMLCGRSWQVLLGFLRSRFHLSVSVFGLLVRPLLPRCTFFFQVAQHPSGLYPLDTTKPRFFGGIIRAVGLFPELFSWARRWLVVLRPGQFQASVTRWVDSLPFSAPSHRSSACLVLQSDRQQITFFRQKCSFLIQRARPLGSPLPYVDPFTNLYTDLPALRDNFSSKS